MRNLFLARTRKEIETHRRIKLSIWAYAYEIYHTSMVDDYRFDAEACKVDLSINTNRPDLDEWFRENFDPCTGYWIHNHPEKNKIHNLFMKYNKDLTYLYY